jgi:hypothetical protein
MSASPLRGDVLSLSMDVRKVPVTEIGALKSLRFPGAYVTIRRRNGTNWRGLRRQTGRFVGRSHPFKETHDV